LGKGNPAAAEKKMAALSGLKDEVEKNTGGLGSVVGQIFQIQQSELKGRLALARGDTLEGLKFLSEAAEKEFDFQRTYADPPIYPEALFNSLGEAYLTAKSPLLAVKAFEKSLDLTHNDLFALSGLVRAYAALGEKARAEDAMARLLFVTADADKNLAIVDRASATGITATPRDSSPQPQRNYLKTSLEKFGPNKWESYAAPAFDAQDAGGRRVTLDEYRGKNVILVFYLGSTLHAAASFHR
jgi:tetratricopeptide (TPR) repeat protein